ncbi:DUF2950 family protein [Enterobacter sp. ENT03]|uniref:DUF2950 family protein n=1 Tax=Enterobacter sp. ENT03 TaxID=2854780 RepID=UPI001C463ABD|nr:DUF2950 family protein [Enterobacter sp. ENT03]MBV7406471.1 DUF2950 domain-containing protein [Enterobacter sp. ENT03]
MKFQKIIAGLLLLLPIAGQAQQVFSTPEQAASTLVSAIKDQNESVMAQLLGDDWRQLLPPDGADPQAVARFLRDWEVSHQIDEQNGVAHLSVGLSQWQLPLPMVKTTAGWQFDTTRAVDEILTRTIGRNELSAMIALQAYADAQHDYFTLNHHYAQKIISSEGKKDGLYWPVSPGEAPSPLGPAFSPTVPGEGYHGYRFRLLTSKTQSSDTPAALLAWPLEYGKTGVATFVMDGEDRMYQQDFGAQTAQQIEGITQFTPDEKWQPVQP